MTQYIVVDPRQQLRQLAQSLSLAIDYKPVYDRQTRLFGCAIYKQSLTYNDGWQVLVNINGQPSQELAEIQAANSALSHLAASTVPMAITHFRNGY